MKHINKLGMMAVAGAMLAAVSCSDYDDFNTAPSAVDPAADKTLWENIASNPDLSEFKSLLEKVGYDKGAIVYAVTKESGMTWRLNNNKVA